MQVTKSEIADRLSILRLKAERLPYNEDIDGELFAYAFAADENGVPEELIRELYEVNGKIWDKEADLRKGKEGELPVSELVLNMSQTELLQFAEVGVRAVAIRNLNAQRIAAKNRQAVLEGDFKECKGDHCSALT